MFQHCQQLIDLQQTLHNLVACSVCHKDRCHYCQVHQDHRHNHQGPPTPHHAHADHVAATPAGGGGQG